MAASGAVVMAAATDLIVLFLGLESLSIALYVMAGSDLRRLQSQESAMKYFVLGAFSSAFFLYGIALVYGATGTTNLVGIFSYLSTTVLLEDRMLLAGLALLLVGLGFKAALVPFHWWTPDVYQGAPTPVTGFFASCAKVAAFAALLRVFVEAFGTYQSDWQPAMTALAVLTLLVGAIVAIVQTNVKRMMAYSSISHAGFILVGVEVGTIDGVVGGAGLPARLRRPGDRHVRRDRPGRPGLGRRPVLRGVPRPVDAQALAGRRCSPCCCWPRPACRSPRASSPSSA